MHLIPWPFPCPGSKGDLEVQGSPLPTAPHPQLHCRPVTQQALNGIYVHP